MRRSFFAYVYNKGEQKLANTVRPYDLYYTNVGVTFGRPLANRSLMATHEKGAVKKSATKPVDSLDMEAHGL